MAGVHSVSAVVARWQRRGAQVSGGDLRASCVCQAAKQILLVVRGAEYGRETAFAQVASDVSGIDHDVVRVHASGRIMVNRQPIKRGILRQSGHLSRRSAVGPCQVPNEYSRLRSSPVTRLGGGTRPLGSLGAVTCGGVRAAPHRTSVRTTVHMHKTCLPNGWSRLPSVN